MRRPPEKSRRQDANLNIRLFSDELAKFRKAAKNAGKPLSEWVRETLLSKANGVK